MFPPPLSFDRSPFHSVSCSLHFCPSRFVIFSLLIPVYSFSRFPSLMLFYSSIALLPFTPGCLPRPPHQSIWLLHFYLSLCCWSFFLTHFLLNVLFSYAPYHLCHPTLPFCAIPYIYSPFRPPLPSPTRFAHSSSYFSPHRLLIPKSAVPNPLPKFPLAPPHPNSHLPSTYPVPIRQPPFPPFPVPSPSSPPLSPYSLVPTPSPPFPRPDFLLPWFRGVKGLLWEDVT